MIELPGTWFDGKTSARQPATLLLHGNGEYRLQLADTSLAGRFADLHISPRLGDTPRRLTLPGGGVLETRDNDAVDALQRQHGQGRLHGVLHRLESRWSAVAGLTITTLLLGWLFVTQGVPALAYSFAFAMPASLLDGADKQILVVLDRLHFADSELDAAQQQQWRQQLLAMTPPLDIPVRIEFRQGGDMGANAFALPGGTVVFTDEIIELAGTPQQIQAVYGHELGHLVHRHGLRRIAQDSLITIAAILLLGDATIAADLFGTVSLTLTDLAWSRKHEREADDYALRYVREQGIAPHHFADMMMRLACSHRSEAFGEVDFDDCLRAAEWSDTDSGDWSNYLSSHPSSVERIKQFQQ